MENYYTMVKVAAEQRRDGLREAEMGRVLRRTGLDQLGWLRVQGDKATCRLGGVLVTLGGHLMCREPEAQIAFSTFAS